MWGIRYWKSMKNEIVFGTRKQYSLCIAVLVTILELKLSHHFNTLEPGLIKFDDENIHWEEY